MQIIPAANNAINLFDILKPPDIDIISISKKKEITYKAGE